MATIARKAIFRELAGVQVDGRNLIVGIHPNGWITVRLKGTSRTAEAPAGWIYRNRLGVAKHLARMQRRQARKEARIAAQIDMAIAARESER